MSCNKPITAFKSRQTKANGKCSISFSPAADGHPIALPCGQCIGCRLDRARSWAMRIYLEAQLHKEVCFVTITYDQENIPHGDTLVPRDMQLFIKRVRKHFWPTRIRFYGCGEYGDSFNRPHYHLVLFGVRFTDRFLHKHRGTYTVDRSITLEKLWTKGFSSVQDFSIESAAYVAKYAVKKITGDKAKEHYEWIEATTGELHERHPEFARMSVKPGIGAEWLQRYYSDLYPKGYITDGKGRKVPPPEYFNKLFERWHPEAYQALREEKAEERFERFMEYDEQRAIAREKIQSKNFNMRRS